MSEIDFYNYLLVSWSLLSLAIFIALFFFDAPYGRLSKEIRGSGLPNSIGWLVMESPAALGFLALFILGDLHNTLVAWIFLGLWELHYFYRAFYYPFWKRGYGKPMPLFVVGLGFFFNLMNVYINGRYLFNLSGGHSPDWLYNPRFIGGVFLYLGGMVINRNSDQILRNLRKPGETGYKIPYGGLYQWVSCPNYLGEIIQWFGWAIATWSLGGLSFAWWTSANLIPRAYSYHRWYQETFPNYPAERNALLPHLWENPLSASTQEEDRIP